MPVGTPKGLLSSLSHIGFIYLKTNLLFHKAGWQLSFLLLLLEIFLGFGWLRSLVRLRLWELSYTAPGSGSAGAFPVCLLEDAAPPRRLGGGGSISERWKEGRRLSLGAACSACTPGRREGLAFCSLVHNNPPACTDLLPAAFSPPKKVTSLNLA